MAELHLRFTLTSREKSILKFYEMYIFVSHTTYKSHISYISHISYKIHLSYIRHKSHIITYFMNYLKSFNITQNHLIILKMIYL